MVLCVYVFHRKDSYFMISNDMQTVGKLEILLPNLITLNFHYRAVLNWL